MIKFLSVLLAMQSPSNGEDEVNQARQLALFCSFQGNEISKGIEPGGFEVNVLLPHNDIRQSSPKVVHTDDPSGFLRGAKFFRYDFKVMNGNESAALVTANYPTSGNLLVLSRQIDDGVFAAAISGEPENQRYVGKCAVMSIPESWFYSEIKRSAAK